MSSKRTRVYTQKQSALRAIVVGLAVLILVNHIMHIGLLFPIQAIWELQERAGAAHTRVVERDWAPEIYRTNLVYLTENENTTLFGNAYLTIYGWVSGFGVSLDCTGEEPLYAGRSYMSGDSGGRVWYFFGRVDDPEIASVAISLRAEDYDEESHAYVGREVRCIPDVELLEQSGRRYFLVRDSGDWDSDRDGSPRPVVVGYDAQGNEVVSWEITDGNASHFG